MIDVVGYEGLYRVTDKGQIYSVRSGKIMKLDFSNKYTRVALQIGGRKKKHMVHRLVAIAYVPNPENKPFVNHIDGDKRNNYPRNVEWTTASENMLHAYSTGLQNPNNGIKFKNNTSGYVGVTACGSKWKAQFRVGGKLRYLGVYATPEEASEVYQAELGMVEGVMNSRKK